MAYQSFPWQIGDSRSYEKLLALDLPKLAGKSVLDLGCNTGFFCGYAQWQGASKVVGIDGRREFIDEASGLFPQCQFLCQDWSDIGEEKYDVILFLSAIHYAPDQQAMLDRLMESLKPDGLLVLELGVAPGTGAEFVEIRRSIDKRYFPTARKLDEMLGKYVFKYIGPSVAQDGDPVPRRVYHVRKRLPLAVLLLDAPHSGKSSIASTLFDKNITRISGDVFYYEIMRGKKKAGPEICAIINALREGDKLNCAAATYQICSRGLMPDLCESIRNSMAGGDFILDMYISSVCRTQVRKFWQKAGYFVVDVSLYADKAHPHASEAGDPEDCKKYMEYLSHNFLIDEEAYLAANPDVARAVKAGRMPGAQFHYWNFGRREGRRLAPERPQPQK